MNSVPVDRKVDVLIIGGGIVGLTQAWFAAQQGHSVLVLDRRAKPRGASVRNFGMIWPIGQPGGARFELAMRSRHHWRELAAQSGIYLRESGSVFAAIDADELAVMEEFTGSASGEGYQVRMLTSEQACTASPLLRPDAVVGGLRSETELNVDPRQAVSALASLLEEKHGVRFLWNTTAAYWDDGTVFTADRKVFEPDQTLVCQGDDACHLFPDVMQDVPAVSCKLHMLRTKPVSSDMGAMIASGLTLRHYPSFEHCSSLSTYSQRVSAEDPRLDDYGIHVMISQSSQGHLVLGDSHQYGDAAEPFHEEVIDTLILDELSKRVNAPLHRIDQRWQGNYLKCPGQTVWINDARPNARIINGLGGNGMTMSFGIAERMWSNWDDPDLMAGLPDPAPNVGAST